MSAIGGTPALARPRRGMTLVELLVVTGLIAVFLGLVVVGVRGSRQSQKRGAETLAAVLSAAQGRALGVTEGGAAILGAGAGGPTNAACTSLFDGVMQPLVEATVTGLPPANPSATSATVTLTPTNGGDVQRAYKIRFLGQNDPGICPASAWMAFTPPSTVQFRSSAGQTPANTVWPKPPAACAPTAVLAQYPSKSSASIDLESGVAIDLSYSGIGDDRSAPYGRLDNAGAIAVVFDRVGRVAEVIAQVPEPGSAPAAGAPQPAVPGGTIYFLVAPSSDILAGANTLASDSATWVALAPQTGRVFVAENVIQSGTDTTALRAARAKARQGVAIGK